MDPQKSPKDNEIISILTGLSSFTSSSENKINSSRDEPENGELMPYETMTSAKKAVIGRRNSEKNR